MATKRSLTTLQTLDQLDSQEGLVETLILSGDVTNARQAIEKYAELTAQLADKPPMADQHADAKQKLKSFYADLGDVISSPTTINKPNQQQPAQTISKPYKPKASENIHDGKTESFRAFWLRLEDDVINNVNIADADRLRYLRDAAPNDADSIVHLSIDDAKEWLLNKYNSVHAVRKLIICKFKDLSMRNEHDLESLEKIKDTSDRLYRTADYCSRRCQDTSILGDLFDAVYNTLPKPLAKDLLKASKAKKDMTKVGDFLESEIELLVARNLSYKPTRPANPNDSTASGPAGPGDLNCRYCHEDGHLIRDCTQLKKHICTSCNTPGHTAKFCSSKTDAVNPPRNVPSRSADPKGRQRVNAVHHPNHSTRPSLINQLIDSYFQCKKKQVLQQLRDSMETLVDNLFSGLVEQAKEVLVPAYSMQACDAESEWTAASPQADDQFGHVFVSSLEDYGTSPLKLVTVEPLPSTSTKPSGSKRPHESVASKPLTTADANNTDATIPAKKAKSKPIHPDGIPEMDHAVLAEPIPSEPIPAEPTTTEPIPTMVFRGRTRPRSQRGRSNGAPLAYRQDSTFSVHTPG